jgi:hypothetical protein
MFAYGLGAYERTQTNKEYPPARGCGGVLVPVAVVGIPSAVVPFVDGKPVPPLIRAFDAGEPVTVGDMRIDRSGIADASRTDGAEPVFAAWSDIRRIPRGEAPAAPAARAAGP